VATDAADALRRFSQVQEGSQGRSVFHAAIPAYHAIIVDEMRAGGRQNTLAAESAAIGAGLIDMADRQHFHDGLTFRAVVWPKVVLPREQIGIRTCEVLPGDRKIVPNVTSPTEASSCESRA
jgi:hypothetical protein